MTCHVKSQETHRLKREYGSDSVNVKTHQGSGLLGKKKKTELAMNKNALETGGTVQW